MRHFKCNHCNSEVDFGVEIKGAANISEAIKQHEQSCQYDLEEVIIPITVHRLKKNGVRLMKLTNTPLSPDSAFNYLKDSLSELRIIAKELDDRGMESISTELTDLIIAFEKDMAERYIWK
jgi:hypothetical protein